MKNKNSTESASGSHNLSLKNRKSLMMDGVKEVVSFNEEKIILETIQGNLYIKGEKLNIKKLNLDDSNMVIEGFISSLEYSAEGKQKGFLNKLFK